MNPRLTKTKYLSAKQCLKRVWYEVRRPDMVAPPTRGEKRIFDQGTEVGELARMHFPGGVLIDSFGSRSLRDTQDALERGATVLFEPALLFDGILVRCDVLLRRPDGAWEIVEVKSSTQVKPYHLDDLAIQRHVAEGCGLKVRGLKLMHINSKDCVYPDLSRLFTVVDVTEAAEGARAALGPNLEKIRTVLGSRNEPDVPIGARCDRPFACPLKHHCWRHVPRASIFTIPHLAAAKVDDLIARGILSVADVPANYPLSGPQRDYVEMMKDGNPRIIPGGIRAMLSDLRNPIHFLDFETIAYAVPRYRGMRPYEAAPFEFSCHVLHEDGRLVHCEYLHTDSSDPRQAVAYHLLKSIESGGSVVVYGAGFEVTVLKGLASAVPQEARRLMSITDRLWDQRMVFQSYYNHPDFFGSTSLKSVVSVLAPRLNFGDLAIQSGDVAQTVWLELFAAAEEAVKERLATNLRDYCRRDTYAMVQIHRVLEAVAKVA